MTTERHPTNDLYRAMSGGVESEDGRTLTIRLAPHDQWAEIHSEIEGHFMERFSRTAYRKTMAEHLPKILFNHGKDPQIGEKPISTTDEAGEDETSPYARGQILDGVPELVVDGLRKGVYGASHRFSVVRESWVDKPKGGPHNPNKLPERTISEARLFELGPVTWPAYSSASASLRSTTDEMRPIVPVAPSLDAAAEAPHLEPERRDEPDPIAAPTPKENRTVEYVTREEKASRVTELKAELARQAIEHPGVLPTDAQTRWDADTSELDTLERDIAAWDSRQARLAAYAQDETKVERSYEPVASFTRKTEADIYDISVIERAGSPEQRDRMYRDQAMRAMEVASYAHPDADVDKTRTSIARLLDHQDSRDKELARRILVTGSPIYRRAFSKYLAGQPLTSEEQRVNSLLVQTDNQGGYAVPFFFDPTLVHVGAHTTINPYRQACTVKQIVGTDTYTGATSAAVTVARAAEAAAASEGGGAIGQVTKVVSKVHAMVTISMEMMEDRSDIVSEVASLIAEAKDTEEENIFTVGDGAALGTSFQPTGMLAAHTVTAFCWTHQDTDVQFVLDADDLYKLEAAVPIRHRMNAAWFMGRATIRAIQALENVNGQLFGGQNYASVGYPVNAPTGNTGLRLLEYPIYEVPSAVTGNAADAVVAGLGDPKSFYIIDRVGMSIEVVPHIFGAGQGNMPTGQRGVYAHWRNTSLAVDPNAGRRLAIHA